MISFRNRRASLVPSTLTFALLWQAGFAFAQSPEGWPFEDKALNPTTPPAQAAPSPQSKSAVQQKLEELYRRDGRPLPDYMRNNAPATATSPQRPPYQQPAQQQAVYPQPVRQQPVYQQPVPQQPAYHQLVQQQPAYQQPSPQQPPYQQPVQQQAAQAAPLPYYASQQPAPLVPPRQMQAAPASESPRSLRQQLSDYYATQGKTMPSAQQGWNSAESPRQPVVLNAGQGAQSGSAAAAAPQPRLIDRLNPFHGFWHKDDSASPPPTPAVTYSNATTQTMSSQNGVSWNHPAPRPVTPAVTPAVVQAPARPAHPAMTVELGPGAPVSSISESAGAHPKIKSTTPQPAICTVQRTVAGSPIQLKPAEAAGKTSVSSPPAALAKAPTTQSGPAAAAPPTASAKVAAAGPARPALDAKLQAHADKKSAPYAGEALQDTDDAITPPEPAVRTATANETAEHPHVAPVPAVVVEEPKRPTQHPAAAAQSTSSSPPVTASRHEAKPDADAPSPRVHLADRPEAPKVFEERQPVGELLHGPEDMALKMHKIGERVGQRGLKGFCPVVLREQRELVDALPVYSSTFESRRYYFSSAEAQARFDRCPEKFAPIAGGNDIVVKATSDQTVEGTLDFAAWYKDRLFLFSSPESLEAFSLNPLPYAGPYLKR